MNSEFALHILPRESMTRETFLATTPPRSIALDGVVRGGPFFDEESLHANFDHHDGVVGEATMSATKQAYMMIKGGLMLAFGGGLCHLYLNDIDEDASLTVYALENYRLFEGTNSIPLLNRLIELTDKLDITGGAFPLNLSDRLIRQHNWIFEPYHELRKSGALAVADESVLRSHLEAIHARITAYHMGQGGEKELDTRHQILFDHPRFKIVDEIGGNEARYHLYSRGMNAFISIVARRPDGRLVMSVGRRSRCIPWKQQRLYDEFNAAEGLTRENGWNGSDLIGGSSRLLGTGLAIEQIKDIALAVHGW